MMRPSKVQSILIWALSIIAYLALPGCVILPYKPASEEVISGNIHLPSSDWLATVGPRELIEEVSEAITSEAAQIEIVDPIVFRDVAFPDGNWRISLLLMKGNGRRIFEELGVKYLVLLGKLTESSSEEYGAVFIYIGFVGAATAKLEASLSATVIDLQNERPLYDISSKAVGTAGGLGLFYGLFIVPLSEASAIQGLGEKVAKALTLETALDSVRIAVMAMEPMDADYALAERLQSLKKQLNEGNDSRELRTELARLGYTEPLKILANEGDRKATIDLYEMTGISGPLYQLAESGDPEAKAIVEAIEARKSRKEKLAIAILTDRAESSSAEAQYQMYMRVNVSNPLVWLCRAADGGHPYARYRLGLLYEQGIEGVEQNYARAQMWYVLASESGHPWGDTNADRIQRTATTEEVQEFSRLLRLWHPGQCELDLLGKQAN